MLSNLHLGHLLSIYALLLYQGIGIFLALFPKDKADIWTILTFAPVFGLSALALYGANLIWLSIPISEHLDTIFLLTTILNVSVLWIRRKDILELKNELQHHPFRSLLINIGLVVFSALIISAPILGLPLTTPWRIGPDAAGYSNCAAFLLQGKTLSSFSGTFVVPSEIYAYEFMVQTIRRGCAAVLAILSGQLGKQPVELVFVITSVHLLLLQLVVYWATRKIFGLTTFVAWLISLAVILNCNILFILYEGGYAQIASMPLTATLIFLFFGKFLRNLSSSRTGLLYGFILAGSASLYLESLIIIIPLLMGYFVISYLSTHSEPNFKPTRYSVGLIAFAVAFLINWDVMIHWLSFQKENSSLLALPGWPQPQWAYYPEIMGWINIYRDVIGNNPLQNDVPPWLFGVSNLITVLLGVALLYGVIKKNPAAKLAIIPALLILAAYIYFKDVRHLHSYSYMKMYTLLLPFLATGTLVLLAAIPGIATRNGSIVAASLSLATVVNGFYFVNTYRSDFSYLTAGIIELSTVEKSVNLNNYVLLKREDADTYGGIREIFIRSLFESKMIHPHFFPQQDFSRFKDQNVALIVAHKGAECSYPADDIIWRGKEYLILNSHIPVVAAWADESKISWKTHPKYIARPEIEVQWSRENDKNGASKHYDFSRYYAKAKCTA